MASQPELPKGFTFSPPEHDLTDVYLRRKIAGQALPVGAGFIHDDDVYSAEPLNLVKGRSHAPGTGAEGHNDRQGVWYFFSPVRYAGRENARGGGGGRKSRKVAGDSTKRWHPESAPKPVKGGSAVGGYEQKFSYMVKDAASGKDKRAGWIMAEYGISPEYGGGDLVLCKIYPSTRSGPGASSTTTSSATTVAVPVSESESSSSSKKRKATGDHPEAPKPCAPRKMDDQDGRPLLPESLEPALTPEDAGDHHHHHHTADEVPPSFSISELFDADDMMEFHSLCRDLFKNEGTTAALPIVIDDDQDLDWFGGDLGAPIADQAERDSHAAVGFVDNHPAEVPPCGFWLQMEEEFESFYQDVVLVSKKDDTFATEKEGDLAAPPCAPAPQPEEQEDAAGNDNQIASLGEVGAQSDEPAPDEVIYGLPCPAFSPEMIRTCGDDVMLWPSPSSLSLLLLGM